MCIKNVNTTMFMCSSLGMEENSIKSFNEIFDSIIPYRGENGYYIENMHVVLNGCIIFDDTTVNSPECFQKNEQYECMIRLTHVSSGLGIPIYQFDIYVEDKDTRTWCKEFYEFKKVLRFPNISIPKGLGNYALKVLIRKKSPEATGPWTTQTIHSLIVGEAR